MGHPEPEGGNGLFRLGDQPGGRTADQFERVMVRQPRGPFPLPSGQMFCLEGGRRRKENPGRWLRSKIVEVPIVQSGGQVPIHGKRVLLKGNHVEGVFDMMELEAGIGVGDLVGRQEVRQQRGAGQDSSGKDGLNLGREWGRHACRGRYGGGCRGGRLGWRRLRIRSLRSGGESADLFPREGPAEVGHAPTGFEENRAVLMDVVEEETPIAQTGDGGLRGGSVKG